MWAPHLGWHDAVAAATFAFYEPVVGPSAHVWAGGYGTSHAPDVLNQVGVSARVGDVDIEVDTSLRTTDDVSDVVRTMLVSDALWHAVTSDPELALPLTLTVVADDRTIDVDGTPVVFTGVRVDPSSRWIGTADVGPTRVQLMVGGPVEVPLRTCADPASIAPLPPEAEPSA